jgi:hypothetical protein
VRAKAETGPRCRASIVGRRAWGARRWILPAGQSNPSKASRHGQASCAPPIFAWVARCALLTELCGISRPWSAPVLGMADGLQTLFEAAKRSLEAAELPPPKRQAEEKSQGDSTEDAGAPGHLEPDENQPQAQVREVGPLCIRVRNNHPGVIPGGCKYCVLVLRVDVARGGLGMNRFLLALPGRRAGGDGGVGRRGARGRQVGQGAVPPATHEPARCAHRWVLVRRAGLAAVLGA